MNQSKWAPRKIANLRHDLSAPLNAIIGYCELLIEECKEKGFNEYIPDLQKCINASKNLLDTIRKGLDPSRFENLNPAQQVSIFDADIDFQLRTSLNTIIGYIELALENAEDEACNDLVPDLNKIHSAAILFQEWIHKVNVVELTSDEEISEYDGSATSSDIQSQEIMIQPMDEDVVLSAQKCEGHILVVDDNPMNQDTLARYLNRLGHKVSMAENGKQALDLLKEYQFDLVLSDIMMPVMNGYQLLKCLKSEAEWHDIPVIMITALDEIDSVVQCIMMGAEDYLTKPFNPILLNARICASLDKKRLRDQEVEYLRKVACITSAAAAVEAGLFCSDTLDDIAHSDDRLGQLARVFQSMAHEIDIREQHLKNQVQLLRIELDEARQAKQVLEITESEYFQDLQAKVQELRQIIDKP